MTQIIGLNEFQDYAAWLTLWREFKPDITDHIALRTWNKLHDPTASVKGLAAVNEEGKFVGFAHYVVHDSTDSLGEKCYVQELFVTEARRGTGIGRQLLNKMLQLKEDYGWETVYLKTREENSAAINFYTKIGCLRQRHVSFEVK
jgi:GNAT superfamily N-acetyltransferase